VEAPGTVAALLAEARALGLARLDAQLLLAQVVRRSRTWLLAHDDEAIAAGDAARARALFAQRASGVPLAYLSGTREFRGLELAVTSDVLVPRPETEALVDWALEWLPPTRPGAAPAVVDLGTGSGAIALALKHARPDLAVSATDASPAALAVAADNARRLGVALEARQGDWWAAVAGRRFALAVSNPPYIAAGDPHLAALCHEPAGALTPGGDGLDALRAIVAGAAAHLEPGAPLLLEHGHDQGAAVRALLAAAGFEAIETRRDLAGLDRLSGGRCPQLRAPDAAR
jgi:release factor glutamine methyltransferase